MHVSINFVYILVINGTEKFYNCVPMAVRITDLGMSSKRGLSRRKWSPATTGPAGPSMATDLP